MTVNPTQSPQQPVVTDPTYQLTPEEQQQLAKIASAIVYEYNADGTSTVKGDPTTGSVALTDAPEMSPSEALAKIQEFMSKLKANNIQTAEESIKANSDEQKKVREQRMEQLQKAAEAIKAAMKGEKPDI